MNRKRRMVALWLILALIALPALAEEDSEESLRAMLREEAGVDSFPVFAYGDYDGDGSCEAFALAGELNDDGLYSGDLWFISPQLYALLQVGLSYCDLSPRGDGAPMLFSAEESYGGSGSTSHLWSVVDGAPVEVQKEMSGGFEYGGGNEFYAYPDEFDNWSDGTGHTWKRYYYFLDGTEMREYGGIYITMEDLLAFEGAKEILSAVTQEGYAIGDIIYRANGIINVNITQEDSFATYNNNLTLRYDGARVTDTGERYGGVYALANTPEIAVYPQAFVPPTGAGSQPGEVEPTSGASELAPSQGESVASGASEVAPSQGDAGSSAASEFAPSHDEAGSSATVVATGDVNLRSGPSLNADTVGVLYAGEERPYLGGTSIDDRGVAWYNLEYEGREAWASSKYTYVDDSDSYASYDDSEVYAEEPLTASPAADVEIPAGTIMTEEEIQAAYGVLNFNQTINTTGVESEWQDGLQVFKLSFEPEVYGGGTSGYSDYWLREGGIAAEKDVDLDMDGVEEHLVFVLSPKTEYMTIYCTVAIFEPSGNAYAFADDFDFDFDWSSEGPRFVRLVQSARGTYIMNGNIGYWDGGHGGMNVTLYGYDGTQAHADLIVNAGTEGSFYFEERIDADLVSEYRDLCDDYDYMFAEAQEKGIAEGNNLHSYTYDWEIPLYDYTSENRPLIHTRFEGIDACAAAAEAYGIDLGYFFYTDEYAGDMYDLTLEGGEDLLWAEEGFEPESWEDAYIRLKLHSALPHVR